MNKYQAIWLIIRLAGVCCAFMAIMTFFSLVGSIPGLFSLPKIDVGTKNSNVSNAPQPVMPVVRPQPGFPNANSMPDTDDAKAKDGDSITAKFTTEGVKTFGWNLLMAIIYFAITWYLLRDGRLIFALLNREEPIGLSTRQKEAEVTSLNLTDQQK